MTKEIGRTFLGEQNWETAEMILELLQFFYLVTTVFSNIYISGSHTVLHSINEIKKYFAKYRDYNQL